MCVCVLVHVCSTYRGQKKALDSSGEGVTYSCELLCGCLGGSGPLGHPGLTSPMTAMGVSPVAWATRCSTR